MKYCQPILGRDTFITSNYLYGLCSPVLKLYALKIDACKRCMSTTEHSPD